MVVSRMSYMKANVNQVYRYLTAYLSAGGHFPERSNSRLRKLASEVHFVLKKYNLYFIKCRRKIRIISGGKSAESIF